MNKLRKVSKMQNTLYYAHCVSFFFMIYIIVFLPVHRNYLSLSFLMNEFIKKSIMKKEWYT